MPDPALSACPGCERAEEEIQAIDGFIRAARNQPGSLIAVLQRTQREFGYLSGTAIRRISEGLDEPLNRVFGVITFYSFFSRVPRGKYLIRICLGTACYVRGAQNVLDAFRKELDIGPGETTPDRLFSLDVARCFGACGLAPAIMVNETVHQRVRPSQVREILRACRDREAHSPESR